VRSRSRRVLRGPDDALGLLQIARYAARWRAAGVLIGARSSCESAALTGERMPDWPALRHLRRAGRDTRAFAEMPRSRATRAPP